MDLKNSLNGSETENPSNCWKDKSPEEIKEELRKGVRLITFTKYDGTERKLRGTLCQDFLPPREAVVNQLDEKSDYHGPSNIAVWDLDISSWRSFKISRLINIEEINDGLDFETIKEFMRLKSDKEYFIDLYKIPEIMYEFFHMLIFSTDKNIIICSKNKEDYISFKEHILDVLGLVHDYIRPKIITNNIQKLDFDNSNQIFFTTENNFVHGVSIDFIITTFPYQDITHEFVMAYMPCLKYCAKGLYLDGNYWR